MRYAVFVWADQTIVYVTDLADAQRRGPCPWSYTTVSHAEAKLYDSYDEAKAVADAYGTDDRGPNAVVEKVVSETEFRSREDTW